MKTVMISFCSYAERKKIKLKFDSSEESIIAYIDKEKTEKIFLNILSNAFKFTPEEGSIEVIVNRYPCMSSTHINCTPGITEFKECVRISVTDSGIGIPKDKLSKIFDRFYQVDNTNKREHEGTGIGLALTKELVELHRGRIEVDSLDGSGTTFTVYIPLGKNHLTPEEIVENTNADNPDFVPGEFYAEETDLVRQSRYPFHENGKPILLLIEDNCDVRNYLKSNLQDEFTIFEAANGLDGWKISEIHLPDLIVSDVMMPGLDGFELCTKIKNDERTSHIPVILLTAKAAAQDKIEGLNLGADEYIMKPFEPGELKARIRNLIEQRKRIHEHFRKHGLFEIDEKSVAKVDKCFLQKVMDKINEHVSDHSLNVEVLIKELAISRSVLQRKLLSLTGETPGELIRRIRLKKAAVLIEQNFGNISEIALEVGFNNPAHFSEAFKKQFGHSPFHYHQKFLRNNSVKK
jgi:DNA-binding response OmpR family regulator